MSVHSLYHGGENLALCEDLLQGFFEKIMDGVRFNQFDKYSLCCVDDFSDDIKSALRENLTRICHGADQASKDRVAYRYPATIKHFWYERYSKKSYATRVGMLGELLSHVIILKMFSGFDVVSPFFNMEEKSIRKGFDLLLYDDSIKDIWITEVKSGGRAENHTSCIATKALLRLASNDLKKRLDEPELNHWYNAINAAKNAIAENTSYRQSVIDILEQEADLAEGNGASALDNNVFLISMLFSDVAQLVVEDTVYKFTAELIAEDVFKNVYVLSIHKNTVKKIEDFLKQEAEQ